MLAPSEIYAAVNVRYIQLSKSSAIVNTVMDTPDKEYPALVNFKDITFDSPIHYMCEIAANLDVKIANHSPYETLHYFFVHKFGDAVAYFSTAFLCNFIRIQFAKFCGEKDGFHALVDKIACGQTTIDELSDYLHNNDITISRKTIRDSLNFIFGSTGKTDIQIVLRICVCIMYVMQNRKDAGKYFANMSFEFNDWLIDANRNNLSAMGHKIGEQPIQISL